MMMMMMMMTFCVQCGCEVNPARNDSWGLQIMLLGVGAGVAGGGGESEGIIPQSCWSGIRLAPVVFVLYLFLSFSTLFFYHDPL